MPTLTASSDGYVQIFVANESDKNAWFDNLKITYTEAPLVQEKHYCPFGLNLTGIEKQGAPDDKFQYNGKEKQEEFSLNWNDYGQRNYDPQLGRFHAIDRFSKKYYDLTPYQYGANNPIKYIDINGDSLTLAGNASGIQKFVSVVNKGSGGFYKATVNKNGLISYAKTTQKGIPTKEQQAFIDNFNAVSGHDVGNVSIEVVESSEDVPIGDFDKSKLDIDDIQQFGNGPLLTEQGALIHEVTEQAGKQLYGMEHGYDSKGDDPLVPNAHDIGNMSENKTNGTTKGNFKSVVVPVDPTRPHVQSGRYIQDVTKSGGTKGKATMIIDRNNVKKVYQ